jgi:hypothetical protein
MMMFVIWPGTRYVAVVRSDLGVRKLLKNYINHLERHAASIMTAVASEAREVARKLHCQPPRDRVDARGSTESGARV